MVWARMLAYITGTVDQELLLRNEYLAAENRILKAQVKGRLLLSEAEKVALAEIAHRLGREALEARGDCGQAGHHLWVPWPISGTGCRTKPWAIFCVAMESLRHPSENTTPVGKTLSVRTWMYWWGRISSQWKSSPSKGW